MGGAVNVINGHENRNLNGPLSLDFRLQFHKIPAVYNNIIPKSTSSAQAPT